jgi:hypothetical protein
MVVAGTFRAIDRWGMQQRGRKKIADAVVIEGMFGVRAEPPADMPPRQAEIWRETVSTEPVDFFTSAATKAILSDYCGHRESIENIDAIIRKFKAEWLVNADGIKRYRELLRLRDSETRVAVYLATTLRLTNQSRFQPKHAATAARNAEKGFRPWDES